MRRGDIYFAKLNPTIGSEINKTRPVLIISNDANNKFADTVTVVPITSNVKKIFPFEVLLHPEASGLEKSSKTQCHQIRTISKLRISGNVVGCLDDEVMNDVNRALMLHLDLS